MREGGRERKMWSAGERGGEEEIEMVCLVDDSVRERSEEGGRAGRKCEVDACGIRREEMSLRMRMRVTGTKWTTTETCSFNCLQSPSAPSLSSSCFLFFFYSHLSQGLVSEV